MLKAARHIKIKELLGAQGQVDVQSLSRMLDVSGVTIRNDLETLEQEGFLTRTHGGAVLRADGEAGTPLPAPPLHRVNPEMLHIARLVAGYVQDGEWVFLGSGYTCCAIAMELASRHVNIVTHNITAAYILAQCPEANVMVLGGVLHKGKNPFLTGDLLTANLNSLFFDKSFFGVSGVDIERGFSLTNMVESSILDSVRSRSREVVVVTDSSKFGCTSHMNIGQLDIAQTIVTDGGIPDEYRRWFEQNGIEVLS